MWKFSEKNKALSGRHICLRKIVTSALNDLIWSAMLNIKDRQEYKIVTYFFFAVNKWIQKDTDVIVTHNYKTSTFHLKIGL